MVNPVLRTGSSGEADRYKVEPYVVAEDVYTQGRNSGRGGWTWYSGASSWLYQLIVESIIGLHRENERLFLKPCLPEGWSSITLDYRYGSAMYHIVLQRPEAGETTTITVDGCEMRDNAVRLTDDGLEHWVGLAPARDRIRETSAHPVNI
jgi:cellobiose phosphorylase